MLIIQVNNKLSNCIKIAQIKLHVLGIPKISYRKFLEYGPFLQKGPNKVVGGNINL
jgi:hypothetical protein